MPQNKKAQKKEIIDYLKKFNKTTGVGLTFEELYDKISNDSSLSSDEILNLKEEMNKSFNGNVASNVDPISDENIKKLDAKNISN